MPENPAYMIVDNTANNDSDRVPDNTRQAKQAAEEPNSIYPAPQKKKSGWLGCVADCLMILSTLVLLVFVVFIGMRSGRIMDELYGRYEDALSVLAPLFPLLFAAVLSRFLYQIARWRLDIGTSLETLEQLMGSRTLGAAVMTHCQLQSANSLALVLLLTWVLSPLGGQSLLRILHQRPFPLPGDATYYDTYTAYMRDDNPEIMKPPYQAALQSQGLFSDEPQDLWGNVKIPFLSLDSKGKQPMVSPYDNTRFEHDWIEVDATSSYDYSSFIGIPIINIVPGNTTFSLESNYIQLSCEPLKDIDTLDDGAVDTTKYTFINDLPERVVDNPQEPLWGDFDVPNKTWHGCNEVFNRSSKDGEPGPAWYLGLDRFIDKRWTEPMALNDSWQPSVDLASFEATLEDGSSPETGPTNLLFHTADSPPYMETQCRVVQKYAESRIACSKPTKDSRAECRVIRQRPSREERPSENLTTLNFPQVWARMSYRLPLATRKISRHYDDQLNYLFSIKPGVEVKSDVKAHQIDHVKFESRLSNLLNSYLLLNKPGFTSTPHDGQVDNSVSKNLLPATWVTVDATKEFNAYHTSNVWMIACTTSCAVLFASAVFGAVFRHLNTGPELLGYVSATLRDSRYIDTPASMDHLDGLDVSMLLKKQRFRYGVYQPGMNDRMGIGREEDIEAVDGRERRKGEPEEDTSTDS